MTEVAFHFNAPDRLFYACRLLRKAYLKGASLQVLADAALATEIDQQLWTLAGTEFIPHCTESASPAMQSRSPILIIGEPRPARQSDEVLVNLSGHFPDHFPTFARVIEVVTAQDPVRALARERWKRYKASGIEPLHLDLNKSATAN